MSNVKIAIIQERQIINNLDVSLKVGLKKCEEAKALGADLVLFPEMWSIGYQPPFESAWDDPNEKGHDKEIVKWNSLAIDDDSKYICEFKKQAKKLKIAIAITYLKKTKGKPENAVSIIDSNGKVILNYSKVHTCPFSMESFLNAGSEFKVTELNIDKITLNIGAMICFDREFPESARTLALKGADIILIPNCCPIDENRKSQLRTRAFENMIPLVMANYAGENLGHSLAFDGMAYSEDGHYRDMLICELGNDNNLAIVNINLQDLKQYQEREVWGSKYRRPETYMK